MLDAFSAIGIGGVAFVSTNGDNLLLLASLRASGRVSPRVLATGYALGVAGVLALILALASVSRLIPVHLVGYLGLVPLALGIRQLAAAREARHDVPDVPGVDAARGEVALVATLQLANSGDTIAVFAPLLAESALRAGLFSLASFAAMSAVWLQLILALGGRAGLRAALGRHAPVVGPLLMIAVGTYVLANTLTDTLPK